MEQSPFQRPRQKLMAEMNVVPYIDVMLVLLVIFMITAPMLTQGLKVELPKVDSEAMQVDSQEPIIITIKADGSYWLKQGKDDSSPMLLEQITESLLVHQQKNPELQGTH
jgi:biopolymer transport protein TolR